MSLVVDYQGVIVQKIQVVGTCCANWSDGLLLANSQLTFLRFEEQKYIIKNSYDGLDKDSEVRAICTNDDKVLALLSSGAMLSGKLRYEANKDTVKVQM